MNNVNLIEKKEPASKRVPEVVKLLFIAVFFLVDLVLCLNSDFLQIRQKAVMSLSVELCAIVLCGFLYFSALIDDRKSRFRSLFLNMVFFEAFAFFLDTIYWLTAKQAQFNTLLVVANALMYLSFAVIFITFWGCELEIMGLAKKIDRWIVIAIRVLTVAYMVAVILNLKFGFFYTIRDGIFTRTRFTGVLEFSYPIFVCEILFFSALGVKTHPKIKFTFVMMALIPVVAMVLQHFHYYSWFMLVAVLLSTFVLYVNVQVNLGHKVEEFKNKVMISQMQPHFMYNTLTTIKALCKQNPELAETTITNFADYLRGNMDFASLSTTIPLEKELEHTKIYTDIESLRFDTITFEYKIEDKDFEVPALCVQPIVENAVRHGVRGRQDGHILIHTFKENGNHVIVIKDNGKGFDSQQLNGSRTHIGLLSTRIRIERLVNGKFEVESVPEKGVTVTMTIPE